MKREEKQIGVSSCLVEGKRKNPELPESLFVDAYRRSGEEE
jgi:hypothetical protein